MNAVGPFTVTEVAEATKTTSRTVMAWIHDGKLRAVRLPGGHYRISSADLEHAVRPPQLADPAEFARPSVAQVELALSEGRIRTVLCLAEDRAGLDGAPAETSRGTIAP